MVTKLVWNAEDPATPALIDPLFEDMGIGADDDLRPESSEQKAEAREATKSYLLSMLKKREFDVDMGDWNTSGYDFYHGYLAGLNHDLNSSGS
ncbi:MAG: hypothetical protein ABSF21_00655 [Dehalococcoidia bacterium]